MVFSILQNINYMDIEKTFYNKFVCDNNEGIFVVVVSFFYSY